MKLQVFGVGGVEITVRQIAELYWEWSDAGRSASREQRLRVDRGDLSDAHRILDAAFEQDLHFDEVVAEIIRVRLEMVADPTLADFGTLSAGPLEDRWNDGDREIFTRLRALGIAQAVLDELESGIGKTEPHTPKPRYKPRWTQDLH